MANVIRLDDPVRTRRNATAPDGVPSGDRCRLRELLDLMGAEPSGPLPLANPPVVLRQVHTGDALFHEGAAAEAIHFVRSGTFKTYRTAEDGYEQVLGFVGRAEVLGFDAICDNRHPTAAVALEDSSVYTVLLRDLPALERTVPAFGEAVHRAVSSALSCRCSLASMMAAVAAEVRLARFLLELSQRMVSIGQSSRRFHLRMCRRDIASYIGVAHETVSRSLGTLVGLGLVEVDQREVEIVDMDGLVEFARSTRRKVEDSWRRGPSGPAALRPASRQFDANAA